MSRLSRVAPFVLLIALPSLAACGGGSGGSQPDAEVAPADAGVPDATLAPDGAAADAAPTTGHPGAGLVPAGAASGSESYRFVGTLSSGGQAASPGHSVRTGVVGTTH